MVAQPSRAASQAAITPDQIRLPRHGRLAVRCSSVRLLDLLERGAMTATEEHNCDKQIRANGWAMSGHRQTGDKWRCACGIVYVHDCDEAEGCSWHPIQTRKGKQR
jgi:hypothetical protein